VSVRPAIAVVAVIAVVGLLAFGLLSKGSSGVALGEAAPASPLPHLEGGGSGSLADYRGRWVLVNFWASWCVPCRDEAPVLDETWRKYRDRGLVVVGVAVRDFSEDSRRFARRYGMTYPIVKANGNRIERQYGITGVPETFFVDRRGNLVGDAIAGPVDASEEIERRFEESIEEALA
jgi:cytochrome c biogenesis protein CcmG/thiol:disulfide interchange protein DsbE